MSLICETPQEKNFLRPHFDDIPEELKKYKRWCTWKYEPRRINNPDDKPTKIPMGLEDKWAKSDDPTTWMTFDEAVFAYNLGGCQGVGFFLGEEVNEAGEVVDCWTGIDLDKCLNYETGEITKRAENVLKEFSTYRDVSPSGTGVKAICRGNMLCRGPNQTGVNMKWCEVYCHGRFFALTGHQWGDVNTVEECQDDIDWLVMEELEAGKEAEDTFVFDATTIDDEEVRRRANWARGWLAQQEPTKQGEKADPRCTAIAFNVLYGFALPPEIAIDLLSEWGSLPGHVNEYGRHYPWTRIDMRRKVQYCLKKGSKEEPGYMLEKYQHERVEEMFEEKYKEKYKEKTADGNCTTPKADTKTDDDGFNPEEYEVKSPEWGPLLKLESVAGGELPGFPVDQLSIVPELHDLSQFVNDAVQIAVDVPAVMGLSVLSAAASDRTRIAVRPGSYLPAILWTATALDPGERKSAAVEPVIRPIKLWENSKREELSTSVKIQQVHRKVARERIKGLEGKLRKCTDTAECIELTNQLVELEKSLDGPEPAVPRLLVEDATSEALVPVLQKHDGRAACLSDEATFLEVAMGRYSDDPKYEMYMKGHDGGDYRNDRAGKEHVYLPRVNLTFGFCIQVDAVKKYAADPVARGRGFWPRFLVSMPHSMLGVREFKLKPPDALDGVQAAWNARVISLLDTNVVRRLDHDEEGYDIIRQFEQKYEPLLADNKELSPLKAWVSKAVSGQMLRIAALLHVASGDKCNTVRHDALRAAIKITEYFLAHTKFMNQVNNEDKGLELAESIKRKIISNGIKTLTMKGIKRVMYIPKETTDETIEAAYEYLVAGNHLRVAKVTGKTTTFEVNPAVG